MGQIKPEDFKFVSHKELAKPKPGHAFIYTDMWCVCNNKGHVAIYKTHYVQGNKNKSIAERLINGVPGGTNVQLIPLIILEDHPGRYV